MGKTEFRARTSAAFACPTGLYEVGLHKSLDVLEEVYLENHGEEAMRAFEKKLLNSESDAAFYRNQKETAEGAWSLVFRRDRLGELPDHPQPHIRLKSQFSFGSKECTADASLRIEWIQG